MKLAKVLTAAAFSASVAFMSCSPKDADIKTAIEEKIKSNPALTGGSVDVKDGIATLGGELKDEQCKAAFQKEASETKGVKSVVNNATITPAPEPTVAPPPPPASLTTTLDAATQQKVKDGLKDIKGVSVEFAADKAVLTGEVTKADRMKIMQMLASAKVKSDVTKLTDKK